MFRPRFWQKIWCKTIYCSGRNKTFRPKEAVSAEKSVSAEILAFPGGPCFGFGVSAKNLFRLTTTDSYYIRAQTLHGIH